MNSSAYPLKISLYNKDCMLVFTEEGNYIHSCLRRPYAEGDYLIIMAPAGSYVKLRLDAAIDEALVYVKEDCMIFPIPFGEAAMSYSPGAFAGEYHVFDMQLVKKPDHLRDLSTNPLDIRGETGFYPHCTATVETRDESVFAARNTIDGMYETNCHGIWPFTSWGDNEDPNAEITIHFGRKITADKVEIFLRSDFPHDNYWESAQLMFDDGETIDISLEKTGHGQCFSLNGKKTSSLTLRKLTKCPTLKSPFPALTYWRVIGQD